MFMCAVKRFGHDDGCRVLREADFASGDTLDGMLDGLVWRVLAEEADRARPSYYDRVEYEFGPVLLVSAVLADPECEVGWTGPSEAPPVADPAALPVFASEADIRAAVEATPRMRERREADGRARREAEARRIEREAAAAARVEAAREADELAQYRRLKAKFENRTA